MIDLKEQIELIYLQEASTVNSNLNLNLAGSWQAITLDELTDILEVADLTQHMDLGACFLMKGSLPGGRRFVACNHSGNSERQAIMYLD